MKGPALRDVAKFIGKAAVFAAKAAGVTQTIAAATGVDTGAPISTELDDAVHAMQQEAIEIEKRLHDMATDEERDEQQMGELQQAVDELKATVSKWQDAYISHDRELSLLRFNLTVVADVVGPDKIQNAINARRAAAKEAQPVQTVDDTNWQNMKGANGATAAAVAAPTWDKDFAATSGTSTAKHCPGCSVPATCAGVSPCKDGEHCGDCLTPAICAGVSCS